MPNIKSAKKRVLVNAKKNENNKSEMSAVRTAIKKVNTAVEAKDVEGSKALLKEACVTLDKAASKGLIHKKNAANKKSGLTKKVNSLNA